MADKQLQALAVKVNDLIQLCDLLDQENRTLKAKASTWAEERDHLVEKTEVARNKVNTMISRLKALESET